MAFGAEFIVSKGDLTPGPKKQSQSAQQRFLFKVKGQRKFLTKTSEGGRKSTCLISLSKALYTFQLAAENR